MRLLIKALGLSTIILMTVWNSVTFGAENKIILTSEEQTFLETHKAFTVCVDPEWYPFEEIDSDGQYRGIAADLLEIVSGRLGLTLEVIPTANWNESIETFKNGNCDLLACLNKTPEREGWMLFTDVYFTDPNVLITREEHGFISNISSLSGETLVLPEGTSIEELVRTKYPNLNILLVESETQALEYVTHNKADLTIRSLTMGAYIIQSEGYFNLKIAGQVPALDNAFRVGVNPSMVLLQQILNKGIATLTQEEVQAVVNKHISIKMEKGFDYQLFFIVFGFFTAVLVVALVWNRQLKQLNAQLAQRQNELTLLSQQLLESEGKYRLMAEELERKNNALEKMASFDKLTGIRNRYYFDLRILEELEIANRYKTPLSLILFDLDHFKMVNDTFGHDIGDDVLIAIAACVERLMRKTDVFARWGGEEFVVLMAQTDAMGATLAAERIRKAVEEIKHPIVGKVTISIGVSVLSSEETLEDWFKRTDIALFKAKRSGRNKVSMSDPLETNMNLYFEWKSAWSCGNQSIDNQHKDLLELGNALIDASINTANPHLLLPMLDKLIDHVKTHFMDEEEILNEYGFSLLESHVASHDELVEKAVALREKVILGELKSTEIFEFIVSDIIMGHMLQDDVKYFPLIAQIESQFSNK